jgi:NAD-dependent SIR2 family protein deacetylase
VKQRGGTLIEVNLYESEITQICDVSLRGTSADVLPRLVKDVAEIRRESLS